ncbi:hypothetical protein SNE35_24975 [Paucibacter sp. R3-3]|uniref:Uncharacterized protein n=1 Tax=Roseateles agri TaxID=3098619 RepID=A0ABU5DPZ3_9BURK|nr:hypothetical protein [Paucibacter sp. R3-3]MDY0747781.1 hypothetical protein [Paucibacter sp. R3-3]
MMASQGTYLGTLIISILAAAFVAIPGQHDENVRGGHRVDSQCSKIVSC